MEEYQDLIFQQEYLIINIAGDYAGKPMQDTGVYALMERLQKKTGIKVTPHMLRHYLQTPEESGMETGTYKPSTGTSK